VGDEIALAGEMTVGRDLANGIVLGDPSVSAFHAVIAVTRDGWRVTDTGSTNGTLVAGRTVEPRGTVLHGGEEISFGKVVVRFQR
jgi:pSer/pThr/pTyr-binding forkhead associated (FHA) protein